MMRHKMLSVLGGILIITLLISTVSLPAKAQEPSALESMGIESGTAQADAAIPQEIVSSDTLPQLTEQQLAQQAWGEQNANRSLPVDSSLAAAVAGPVPGTESTGVTERPRAGEPLAPGDPSTYIWTQFGSILPATYNSNIMEMSTDGKGQRIFATGNWWAARSYDKGRVWSYINPYADLSDFCCDQVTLHDVNRDIYIWERMGVPDGNGVNRFRLTVDFADPFSSAWSYDFYPTNTNGAWTNQWWDYPHMQLGTNNLYIAWNMFDINGNFVRTVMLILPLDALAAGTGFSYSYVTTTSWFTWVPVSGAQHYMYWASNWPLSAPQNSRLSILRFDDKTGALVGWEKTVTAWTLAGRGAFSCGSPNWLARTDFRLLTGTIYKQNFAGFNDAAQIGRSVVAWWWNVAQGGGFTYPYIESAAFFEDTMVQLPGYIGRPNVYGSWCFAYPSITANIRGDLGGIVNGAGEFGAYQRPNVYYMFADDYSVYAPPGWTVLGAAGSGAGPTDQAWGDYNTVRTYQQGTTWIGGTHFIIGGSNCNRTATCAMPLWMGFGRERDGTNFRWW